MRLTLCIDLNHLWMASNINARMRLSTHVNGAIFFNVLYLELNPTNCIATFIDQYFSLIYRSHHQIEDQQKNAVFLSRQVRAITVHFSSFVFSVLS